MKVLLQQALDVLNSYNAQEFAAGADVMQALREAIATPEPLSIRDKAKAMYAKYPTYKGTRALTWMEAGNATQREWIDKAKAKPINCVIEPTDAEILALARRMGTTYAHRSDPTYHSYAFTGPQLLAFVRAVQEVKK